MTSPIAAYRVSALAGDIADCAVRRHAAAPTAARDAATALAG